MRSLPHSIFTAIILLLFIGIADACSGALPSTEGQDGLDTESSVRISSLPGERYFNGQSLKAVSPDNYIFFSPYLSKFSLSFYTNISGFRLEISGLDPLQKVFPIGKNAGEVDVTVNDQWWAPDKPRGTVEIRHVKMEGGKFAELWMVLTLFTPDAANITSWNPPLLVEVRWQMPSSLVDGQPPIVTAGMDRKIMQRQRSTVAGNVLTVDGQPPTLNWSKLEGPGDVTFVDPEAPATEAMFSIPGNYVLRLTADDGVHVVSDDVALEVSPLETSIIIRGIPLTPGALPFARLYTADEFWCSTSAGGATIAIRSGQSNLFDLSFGSRFEESLRKPGIYTSGPLDNAALNLFFHRYEDDQRMSSKTFAIHEIKTDENGQFTAFHTELRGETYPGTHYLIAEIRINAQRLSQTAQNRAPYVLAPGPHCEAGKTFSLDAYFNDDSLPPEVPPRVTWVQTDGPSVTWIDDPHCVRPSVQVLEEGVYKFRLTIEDGESSASSESTVVVGTGGTKYFRGVVIRSDVTIGRFRVAQRRNGSFTASVTIDGTTFSMIGKFKEGRWVKSFKNVHGDDVTFYLEKDVAGTALIGAVYVGDRIYEMFSDEVQSRALAAADQETPRAGTYNILLTPAAPLAPKGDGFAQVTVRGSGVARGVARLPDGSSVSFGTKLTSGDCLPFYARMYGGRGFLGGELQFETDKVLGQPRVHGRIQWWHPRRKHRPFTEAFGSHIDIKGGRYVIPDLGSNLFTHFSTPQNGLFEARLADDQLVSIPVRFNTDGSVLPTDAAPGFALKVGAESGIFEGTFSDPRDGKPLSFKGIIDAPDATGGGYYLAPTEAGRIRLQATP